MIYRVVYLIIEIIRPDDTHFKYYVRELLENLYRDYIISNFNFHLGMFDEGEGFQRKKINYSDFSPIEGLYNDKTDLDVEVYEDDEDDEIRKQAHELDNETLDRNDVDIDEYNRNIDMMEEIAEHEDEEE